MINFPTNIVVFQLDGQDYALRLGDVERVVRVVASTGLPGAPDVISGVIAYQGGVVPVVDVRKRLRLPARVPELSDHLLFARTSRRRVAMVVDAVSAVFAVAPSAWVDSAAILSKEEYIAGVVMREDGLVLIHNLDSFLSLEEEQNLDRALDIAGGVP